MKCQECGHDLPSWDDLPAALETMLSLSIPVGLRPMLRQAIYDLRRYKALEEAYESAMESLQRAPDGR